MACTRLKLDWSIETEQGRSAFVDEYLADLKFEPNSEELETIASYILWGRDENGQNSEQRGEVELERKNSTWKKATSTPESLEALMENPGWNENQVMQITKPRTKITREVFSRSEARKKAPSYLLPNFEDIWNQIDKVEYLINLYDLDTGKRKNPPREELIQRLTESEKQHIAHLKDHLSPGQYLFYRHLLVDLRREQYDLKDSYSNKLTCKVESIPEVEETFDFQEDCLLFPFDEKSKLIFIDFPTLNPASFSKEDITEISRLYWKKKREEERKDGFWFDFRNNDHVYQLILSNFDENSEISRILKYYIKNADLTDVQRDLLDLKMRKRKNSDIADILNEKYGKNYTTNYISTIFTQKTVPKIAEAAAMHEEIVGNIFFPENFKACSCCKRIYLITADNFVRKSNSPSGYSARCKKCDKEHRRRYREK